MTREEWLESATFRLRTWFKLKGYDIPENVRMTCGFPSQSALPGRKQRIGECWDARSSEGKVFEIFISPVLAKPIQVLETLAHELVHATVGLEAGHKGPFAKCARKIGLEGKLTATHAGEDLQYALNAVVGAIGDDYPHEKLLGTANVKKQTTRLIKCACPECGYTVRTTRQWLDMGAPKCGVCEDTEMEEA